jgi:predicted transcriptional regulator
MTITGMASLITDKKRIYVKDVMKPDFGTISGNATIAEALDEMKRLQTAVLIVDKRNEDDEYGLLLVSDIACQVLAMDKASSRVNVYEIMTKPAVCVAPDMDIRYCSRLMSTFNLMRVLVVKNGAILGTVSPRALVLDGLVALEADD